MDVDLTALTISVSKPKGKPARMLEQMGVLVLPLRDDEGPVDRYLLSKRLAVERRTGGSFLRGIMDKTLFTSAIYLREHFRLPVLIVEGEVNYEYSGFDPQAIRGALSSMMLQYGLNILATPDVEETAALIAMMARQEQVGIPEISLIPKRKATELPDRQRRLVEMLPGCGMVMARELLQHFGSVKRIANADADEFRARPGIGAKKAADIVKVLNAEYEAVDTERDLEDAIEEAPNLLFDRPVDLLARQHHIYTDEKQRHIVDLIFLDEPQNEVILVELKRGKLAREHCDQIVRYLDNARQSKLLRACLDQGRELRGLLATVEQGRFRPAHPNVSARVVDRRRVITVLRELRRRRHSAASGGRRSRARRT